MTYLPALSIIISIICSSLLWHHNPIVGTIAGPIIIVAGLIGAWILKPKAERIIDTKSVIDEIEKRI